MKKSLAYLLLAFALTFSSSDVEAHSGRTDSSGGHNCRVGACAGTYHYHNGGGAAPAVQAPIQQAPPVYVPPTKVYIAPTNKPYIQPTKTPTPTNIPSPTLEPTKIPTPTVIEKQEVKALTTKAPKKGFWAWIFSLLN